MKVKVRFNSDDILILALLFVGAVIAIFGIYVAGSKLITWLSGALSNLDISV